MSAAQTIPMFAPDGTLGDIPIEQANAARSAGAKPAVNILDPQGNHGYVPADRVQEAVQAGGKVLPFEHQEVAKPGAWDTIMGDLKGLFTNIPTVTSPYPGMDLERKQQVAQQSEAEDQARKAAGYGPAYRALAPVAEAAGTNVSGMEQAAKEGNEAAVLGHAAVGAGLAAAPVVAEKGAGVARDYATHLAPIAPLVEEATEAPRANFAASRISKLIKPMAGDLKYGAEPAAALPKEGITGNTLEDLGEKVYNRARDVGQTIDAVAQAPQNAGKVVDVAPAINGPIDDAIRNAVRTGDKTLYDKLQAYKKQVLNVWQEVEGKEGKSLEPVAPRKLQMSPMDAIKLKRDIADMTRWTGDPMDNEVNAVKARQFGGIKDVVNQAVPDLVELNQRYADLVNAGKSIERRAPVAARSNDFSLGDLGTMVVGKSLTGSPAIGIAAEMARRAAHNPGVVSRVANAIMPDSLKYEEPAAIRARLGNSEPPAPKGTPEGGKPPQPERRSGGEPGPRSKLLSQAEREALLKKTMKETADRLGPITRDEILTGKPVSPRAQDILSGQQ